MDIFYKIYINEINFFYQHCRITIKLKISSVNPKDNRGKDLEIFTI